MYSFHVQASNPMFIKNDWQICLELMVRTLCGSWRTTRQFWKLPTVAFELPLLIHGHYWSFVKYTYLLCTAQLAPHGMDICPFFVLALKPVCCDLKNDVHFIFFTRYQQAEHQNNTRWLVQLFTYLNYRRTIPLICHFKSCSDFPFFEEHFGYWYWKMYNWAAVLCMCKWYC